MKMNNCLSVVAVIVTYNRKDLLTKAIDAVLSQSYKCTSLYIVDNASSDGTYESVIARYFRSMTIDGSTVCERVIKLGCINGVEINYYRKSENGGGAGGFYTGLKIAHETGLYDAFWLMDDDGYPSEECLKKQMEYISEYDYIMPVSIDIDNHANLSWATRLKNGKKTENYVELKREWGSILPFIFPFNGSLLSKKIVDAVGYINPKLFIWGDDYEHYFRCLKKGFKPVTLLDAVFYHPVNKAPTIPILGGLVQIPFVESDLRFVCLIRNWAYINKTNARYLHLIKTFAGYTWLYLFHKEMGGNKYKLFLQSFKDGLVENFERHKKYLK